MPFYRPTALVAILAAALPLLVAGCATLPGERDTSSTDSDKVAAVAAAATAAVNARNPASQSNGTSSQMTAAATAAAAAVQQGQPRAFSDVIKDAKEMPGFLGVWQKDERVWIEIAPEQFNTPILFTANLSRGIGEKGVYGGMMLMNQLIAFKRVGNSVQMLGKNQAFTGGTDAALAQGVREGFTDSLLGVGAVVSQPHPERKTVLIDANALLLTDIPAGERFTVGVHMRGYSFDPRNSSFDAIRATPDLSVFTVAAHYQNPRASLPSSPSASGAAPSPFPPFTTLPDARSLFLGYTYSFARLPEPMAARRADPRVGHFDSEIWDFSNERKYTPRTHYVNRWRLEKRDPGADVSEPKQPIVFWIDRTVPERFRPVVRDGILEWNKAFEKIGFNNAIIVHQQPDDAEFTTYDVKHATVRWFVSTDAGFAIGPSQVDPRTGEILDADVAIPESWSRGDRTFITEQAPTAWPAAEKTHQHHHHELDGRLCTLATEALNEMQFGHDLLVARGDFQPDSAEANAFVAASMKAVIMHEVGHALGLRHNFRGSTVYPLSKIADPRFSKGTGITGSIMDYIPLNIAVKGEPQGSYVDESIGPYDYWAIEYAYKPLARATENAELEKIAARGASDPLLAYSSDEEVLAGLDPDASQFDLGNDTLAYLQKRLQISSELWQRLETRELKPGESYDVLRRSFDSGFRQVTRAAVLTSKYVGGVSYVRDFGGSTRKPLTPVSAERQRAALNLLTDSIFSATSFRFKPDLMRSMGIDYLNIGWNSTNLNPDFSLRARVLTLQSGLLSQLMSDTVMSRLLDSEAKVAQSDQALLLPELFATLQRSVWSELNSGGSIPAPRRDLQREHLRRVAGMITRPSSPVLADARALMREDAKSLSAQIKRALARNGLDRESRAHLSEAANTLDEALKAPLMRQGV